MTYATLMVHLELGRSNAGLLRVAGDLARRFEAGIIGIAACQPMPMYYADGYSGAMIEEDRVEMAREIKATEEEFRSVLQGAVADVEWRSTVAFGLVADYLACEARAADLVLTGVATGDMFDASRAVNTGDLLMQAGRPVLVVPLAAETLKLEQVLVGWKETREARRAVVDALPFLKQATRVTIASIASPDDMATSRTQLEDVARWLKRHGVAASALASPASGNDAAALYALAQDQGADLIVAGAYGHTRLREWVLGGVTTDLLLSKDRYSFVSH
jgi:nucleotide-binding universal stress UspA family protein